MRKVPIRALTLLALIVCLGYPAAATTILFNSSNTATYSANFTDYVDGTAINQLAASPNYLQFTENNTNAVTLYSGSGNTLGSSGSIYVDFQLTDAHNGNHGSTVGIAFLTSTSAGSITNGFTVIAGNGVDAGNGNGYIALYALGSTGVTPGALATSIMTGAPLTDGASAPWYRLVVFYTASGSTVSGTGQVYNLIGLPTANNVGTQVGSTLNFSVGSVLQSGQLGIVGDSTANPNAVDNVEEITFAVPEPGTWVTFGGGLLGLFALRRKFRK